MTTLPVALAALTLAAWVTIGLIAFYSERTIPGLHEVALRLDGEPPLPPLSIVVAARNEARTVEQALRSLLALRYPDYEVVFVNDRSEDRTGAIAEQMAAGDTRLKVLHVKELPAGWFGKNHAAQRGADAATGEVLLFTDGDVTFAPDGAARGVRYLVREALDHLSAAPRLTVTGTMLRSCTIAFRLFVGALRRLWKVRDPGSSAYFGIGSCTIIRADAYRAIGGHRQVALRPDEDIRIGQLVKLSGMRSAFLHGEGVTECPWYESLNGLVRGLEKNLFAALDYSVWKVMAASAGLIWLAEAPIVLAPLLLSGGATLAGALFAACPLLFWVLGMTVSRDDSYPWWTVIPFPLAVLIMVYMLWRSTILTMVRGVVWGGPAVPLSVLRRAKITTPRRVV